MPNLAGRLTSAEKRMGQRAGGTIYATQSLDDPGRFACDALDGRRRPVDYRAGLGGDPPEHYHFTRVELEAAAHQRGAQLVTIEFTHDWQGRGYGQS